MSLTRLAGGIGSRGLTAGAFVWSDWPAEPASRRGCALPFAAASFLTLRFRLRLLTRSLRNCPLSALPVHVVGGFTCFAGDALVRASPPGERGGVGPLRELPEVAAPSP